MDKLRSLLEELKADEYVRFKYGKRLDVALKTLEAQGALDARELEARLTELLDWTRGKAAKNSKKGGAPAGTPSKSRATKGKADAVEA
jgi:hypothetical protein